MLWVAKEVVLFFLLWQAYDPDQENLAQSMVGEHGVAMERLNPSGYVRVRGELWRAQLCRGATTVKEGERVRVEELRGLTLLVVPDRSIANI